MHACTYVKHSKDQKKLGYKLFGWGIKTLHWNSYVGLHWLEHNIKKGKVKSTIKFIYSKKAKKMERNFPILFDIT